MERKGELKREDEEGVSSSSDGDSNTFVYITGLSDTFDYSPQILFDSTEYKKLEERYEVKPSQLKIETVGTEEITISDVNEENNSSSYRLVIFLDVVTFLEAVCI